MRATIPVYFDYASSLCFIAAVIGTRLEAELEFTLDWRPVQIAAHYPGFKHGVPIDAASRAKINRVSAETGVALTIPRRWPDSRAALLGAFFAREQGRFGDYHHRLFHTAFTVGDDIEDIRVLQCVAEASGLAADAFHTAVTDSIYTPRLAASLAEARRFGVAGYPTFFLGEFPLTGIQPVETMRLLFQRYLDRQSVRAPH